MVRKATSKSDSGTYASSATIDFEVKFRLTDDKLRNNMDAAENKHVVLGRIFLNYISDTFVERCSKLLVGECEYAGANTEAPDEYKAENVFWVPADEPGHFILHLRHPARHADTVAAEWGKH